MADLDKEFMDWFEDFEVDPKFTVEPRKTHTISNYGVAAKWDHHSDGTEMCRCGATHGFKDPDGSGLWVCAQCEKPTYDFYCRWLGEPHTQPQWENLLTDHPEFVGKVCNCWYDGTSTKGLWYRFNPWTGRYHCSRCNLPSRYSSIYVCVKCGKAFMPDPVPNPFESPLCC